MGKWWPPHFRVTILCVNSDHREELYWKFLCVVIQIDIADVFFAVSPQCSFTIVYSRRNTANYLVWLRISAPSLFDCESFGESPKSCHLSETLGISFLTRKLLWLVSFSVRWLAWWLHKKIVRHHLLSSSSVFIYKWHQASSVIIVICVHLQAFPFYHWLEEQERTIFSVRCLLFSVLMNKCQSISWAKMH